ncbi:MAG: helix-turn-helix domain-containing protein [Candidatus Limnocylindrales bacterium]
MTGALELGSRIRDRRRALGLTQTELGEPLTKGFVSAVERGRSLPSLAAVCLFALRLGTSVDSLVCGVEGLVTERYTARHDSHDTPSRDGGSKPARAADRRAPS